MTINIFYIFICSFFLGISANAQIRNQTKVLPEELKISTLLVIQDAERYGEKRAKKLNEELAWDFHYYPFKYIICKQSQIDSITNAVGGIFYTLSAGGNVSIGGNNGLNAQEVILRKHEDYGDIYYIRYTSSGIAGVAKYFIKKANKLAGK